MLVVGAAAEPDLHGVVEPREGQVVAGSHSRRRSGAARRLAGRSLGVVLSGGGAAAFAEIGVIEVLTEAGFEFDRVAGVSLGALVGAALASGLTPRETYETFERAFVRGNPTSDLTVPAYALLRGAKTRRLIREAAAGRRIEELPRRFFCVSCDLVRHEAVMHRWGSLADAIYPSLAIPGVFPPVPTPDGRLLVDGGVIDNLPVAAMARKGKGRSWRWT